MSDFKKKLCTYAKSLDLKQYQPRIVTDFALGADFVNAGPKKRPGADSVDTAKISDSCNHTVLFRLFKAEQFRAGSGCCY